MRKALISLSLLACCSANALITMSLQEDTDNGGVILSFSGSANIEALTYTGSSGGISYINLPYAIFESSESQSLPFDEYSGISGPTSFGSGDFAGTYTSGDSIGVYGYESIIFLPEGYVSGTLISGQSFFERATIAAMGFTIGDTFEWTWGSGANADRMVFEVLSPIPEPTTVALLSAGAAALLTVAVRRRKAKA